MFPLDSVGKDVSEEGNLCVCLHARRGLRTRFLCKCAVSLCSLFKMWGFFLVTLGGRCESIGMKAVGSDQR